MATLINFSTQQYFGFDPRTIPGCLLWLDSADSNTLFSDSAGTTLVGSTGSVGMWRDKSLSERHYIQSTTANRPTLANNTITTGNNTREHLSNVATLAATGLDLFFVGNPHSNTVSRFRVLFRDSVATDLALLMQPTNVANSNVLGYYTSASFRSFSGVTLSGLARTLVYVSYSASLIPSAAVNGTAALSVGPIALTANSQFYTLGGRPDIEQPWGEMNEVILISNTTQAQRQQVEGYLAWKWGLQANLPVGHTFRPNPTTMRVFQPIDINTCRLWLDAADASTVQTSGANVTTWLDKSGSGLNFSQATTARQPTYSVGTLNGQNGILFTGAGTSGAATLSLSNAEFTLTQGAYSIFVVARQNASAPSYTGYNYLLKGSLTDGFLFFGNHSSKNFATFTSPNSTTWNDTNSNSPPVSTSNNPLLLGMTVSNTVLTPYYSGIAQNTKTGTTGAFTGMVLGDAPFPTFSGQNWNGVICEICIFNSTLTTSQRQQIEGYLTDKWRVAALPTTHPYSLQRALPSTPVFTPAAVSGLALWLDAADSSTFTFSSGSNISSWADKSGLNNHASQVSSTPPVYSSTTRSVVFNAPSANFIRGNLNTSYSSNAALFMVVSYTSNAATPVYNPRLFIAGVSNAVTETSFMGQLNLIDQPTPFVGTYVGNGANPKGLGVNYQTGVTIQYSTPFVYTNVSTYNTSTSAFTNNTLVNGLVTANGTGSGTFSPNATYVSTYNRYSMGGYVNTTVAANGDSYNGNIYECILISSALTTSQRQQVEGYLAWKWGRQTSLPTTHPYYKFRP
jgi:hypothetical protein